MFSKFRPINIALLVATALTGLTIQSCSPASYEILKPGKKGSSPDRRVTEPEVKPPTPTNLAPTARVEVIVDGKSMTRVRVNQPTTIQPSFDTVDPDDIDVIKCANPGIVKADYNLGDLARPSATRAKDCDALSVPYTFATPGEYEISMLVTSNDGETATAKMTLVVIDANAPLTGNGGFTISADPMIPGVDQRVTFTARCDLQGQLTITWNFGDGETATGSSVTHAYKTVGARTVKAVCTDPNGTSHDAEITISVADKPITIPGKPTPLPTQPTPTPTPTPVTPVLPYDPGTQLPYDPTSPSVPSTPSVPYDSGSCGACDPYGYDTGYYIPY